MKKLAIVSSYNESCGNATFTKCLHDSIEQYMGWDVEVIALKLSYLQAVDPFVRKLADEHVQKLALQLKEYDAVNIQLENGLYGTMPGDILKRVKILASANKNTSVTLHSVRVIPSENSSMRRLIKGIITLKFRKSLKLYIESKKNKIMYSLNRKMIAFFAQNNIKMIVHTQRAYEIIRDGFKNSDVHVHPLCFFEEKPTKSPVLNALNKIMGDDKSTIKIGVFGYISSYKGIVDAVLALKSLPDNYKLLICGRQHPQTIMSTGKVDEYLGQVMELAEESTQEQTSLKKRIYFLGELDDDQFLSAIREVDITWLPYYENGQDASGIAALCIKYAKRVLCSASFAFDELFKFFPPSQKVMRFDIGNYIEIAQKTQISMQMAPVKDPVYEGPYRLDTQASLYTTVFEK